MNLTKAKQKAMAANHWYFFKHFDSSEAKKVQNHTRDLTKKVDIEFIQWVLDTSFSKHMHIDIMKKLYFMEKRDTHMHIDITKKLYFMAAKYDVIIKFHWGMKVVIMKDKDEPYQNEPKEVIVDSIQQNIINFSDINIFQFFWSFFFSF